VENKRYVFDTFFQGFLHKLEASMIDASNCDVAYQVNCYQTEDDNFVNFHLRRDFVGVLIINNSDNCVGQQNQVDCNGCQKSETKPAAQLFS
jgi:hypothetical protein